MRSEVAYWMTLAEEDLASARDLHRAGHYLTAAYHCQQALEKMLKALVQEQQPDPPPRTHDLVMLAGTAGAWVSMSQAHRDALREVGRYGIEARYPTVRSDPLDVVDEQLSQQALQQTEEVMAWLRTQLASPSD